jgi:hypothetical protein
MRTLIIIIVILRRCGRWWASPEPGPPPARSIIPSSARALRRRRQQQQQQQQQRQQQDITIHRCRPSTIRTTRTRTLICRRIRTLSKPGVTLRRRWRPRAIPEGGGLPSTPSVTKRRPRRGSIITAATPAKKTPTRMTSEVYAPYLGVGHFGGHERYRGRWVALNSPPERARTLAAASRNAALPLAPRVFVRPCVG